MGRSAGPLDSPTHLYPVTGQFHDAVTEGRTRVLSWETIKFDVRIKGDGGGYVRRK